MAATAFSVLVNTLMIALAGLTPDDDIGSKFTVPSDSAYQLFGAGRITMPPSQ
jgi:hypothetical protein